VVHQPAKELDLTVEFAFSAAHRLPRYQGPCFDLHGHNYVLFVTVCGVPDADSGLILDFDDIEKIVQQKVLSRCDHKYLNDFIENPTAEIIIQWMWGELAPALEGLFELKLYETPRFAATLRRQ
jgi:6-pyruvoyltetrahydropterin/6-carboxytetrahydropterin synthase